MIRKDMCASVAEKLGDEYVIEDYAKAIEILVSAVVGQKDLAHHDVQAAISRGFGSLKGHVIDATQFPEGLSTEAATYLQAAINDFGKKEYIPAINKLREQAGLPTKPHVTVSHAPVAKAKRVFVQALNDGEGGYVDADKAPVLPSNIVRAETLVTAPAAQESHPWSRLCGG